MIQPWQQLNDVLSDEEIQEIIDTGDKSTLYPAEVGEDEFELDIESRVADIAWIKSRELQDILYHHVSYANGMHWGFDIFNYCREMQYTVYNGSEEQAGYYRSHRDMSFFEDGVSQRKISLTIQLSDPEDYEGGDFVFTEEIDMPDPIELKKKGTVLIFPSYMLHEVQPVTSGIRKSLVVWFEGPRWR